MKEIFSSLFWMAIVVAVIIIFEANLPSGGTGSAYTPGKAQAAVMLMGK